MLNLKRKMLSNNIHKRLFVVVLLLMVFVPSIIIVTTLGYKGRIYGYIFYLIFVVIGVYEITRTVKALFPFLIWYVLVGIASFYLHFYNLTENIIHTNNINSIAIVIQNNFQNIWQPLLLTLMGALLPIIVYFKLAWFGFLDLRTVLKFQWKKMIGIPFFGMFFIPMVAKYFWILNILNVWALGLLISISSISDTMALFGGMLFGKKFIKRPFTPMISPNKTWEGAISGYLSSAIAIIIITLLIVHNETLLNNMWFVRDKKIIHTDNMAAKSIFTALITMVLPIVSILGDLFFSWIKRKTGIKDYSQIIPGHGGILDRFDSLFLVTLVYIILIGLFNIGT